MNADKANKTESRPPVVVVMGHVDHGKTTLIDYIRKTNVASREAGQITQSIGAYEIEHNNRRITFIDTPGHEAFTKMRSRGARVADLAVLLVAADDGVKPQTKEAAKILEEAKIPFVVAINKVDRPEANIDKVKQELTEAGVFLEGFGGNISFQPISAKRGDGVSDLLDLIILAADVENLTYSPEVSARGFVLEAKIDSRRGREVSVVLKDGVLRTGDDIFTPTAEGKIKILENFLGEKAGELIPSAPALVIGFEDLPKVGEEFFIGSKLMNREVGIEKIPKSALIQANANNKEPEIKIILKASDAGSIEALGSVIRGITPDNEIAVVGESVGDVGDGDVKNAIATKSIIVGFKNKISKSAENLAEANGIKIVTSPVIYDLIKSVEGLLADIKEPPPVGELEILAVFNQEKQKKQLVGGKVVSGIFKNSAEFDISRGEEIIGRGRVASLQSQKQVSDQVEEGKEAGLVVEASVLIEKGDRLIIKGRIKHKK